MLIDLDARDRSIAMQCILGGRSQGVQDFGIHPQVILDAAIVRETT